MTNSWQLQEAEKNLDRVIENATYSEPQIITRHGVDVAVVLSPASYHELLSYRGKLSTYFRESSLAGIDLDLARDRSLTR